MPSCIAFDHSEGSIPILPGAKVTQSTLGGCNGRHVKLPFYANHIVPFKPLLQRKKSKVVNVSSSAATQYVKSRFMGCGNAFSRSPSLGETDIHIYIYPSINPKPQFRYMSCRAVRGMVVSPAIREYFSLGSTAPNRDKLSH